MSKFCGLCGKPIESGTVCAQCGGSQSPVKPMQLARGGATPPKKSKKKLIIAVIAVLAVAVIAAVIAIAVSGGGESESYSQGGGSESSSQKGDKPQSSSEEIIWNSSYDVPEIDAQAFYSANGSIVSSILAPESTAVLSERQVYEAYLERELMQSDVYAQYDMEGNMIEMRRISNFSDAKHPEYVAYYTTASGDIWSITVINGKFIANPLSYNAKKGAVQVLFAEGDTLEAYDSVTNKFYTVKPNAESVNLKSVARIDAQTLEALTEGAIDAL